MFIGTVNYYRDIWPSQPHVLVLSKKSFQWTLEMDKAFYNNEENISVRYPLYLPQSQQEVCDLH